MESDILDERQEKQTRYDLNVDMFKSQMHEKMMDSKVKFEEDTLRGKEELYRQKIQIQGLNERNQLLKE